MTHGGSSMVAPLRRVLLAAPDAAGWGDPERIAAAPALGYPRPADAARARVEHAALTAALMAAGVEILDLPQADEFSLDAVFTHDASFMTDAGAILLAMGKPARAAEPTRHGAFYERIGVPILGRIESPGTVEGGDLVWLDAATILAGRGYRTNAIGIEQLRALVAPAGVEVVAAPLPHGQGPEACLHLMSLVSLLDETTALVDVAWLSVPTLELLRDRGYALIPIEPAERDHLATNVLSLGKRRLLAMEGSPETRRRMEAAGFEVRVFPGGELGVNGGGGPTCLTRSVLRGES